MRTGLDGHASPHRGRRGMSVHRRDANGWRRTQLHVESLDVMTVDEDAEILSMHARGNQEDVRPV